MQDRHAPHVRPMPRPFPSSLFPDADSVRSVAHMQALRAVLSPVQLPPPVVPLRAQIVETHAGQRLFVEVRNLSGVELSALGIEAVTLDDAQREIDVMFAFVGELGIAADPRRVVPVGGLALDPRKRAASALVTAVYAHFADGSGWEGELDALEDPRLSERGRALARERFFAPYARYLSAVDGSGQLGPLS